MLSTQHRRLASNAVDLVSKHFAFAGVIGAAAMLLRTDIRSSGKMLQRNIKTIRSWVEEAQEGASK